MKKALSPGSPRKRDNVLGEDMKSYAVFVNYASEHKRIAVLIMKGEYNMNINKEQKAAAEVLADEIFLIRRDAEQAHFMINDLFDGFFDESTDTSRGRERIVYNFERAQMQANILLDYVSKLKKALSELSEAASIKSVSKGA